MQKFLPGMLFLAVGVKGQKNDIFAPILKAEQNTMMSDQSISQMEGHYRAVDPTQNTKMNRIYALSHEAEPQAFVVHLLHMVAHFHLERIGTLLGAPAIIDDCRTHAETFETLAEKRDAFASKLYDIAVANINQLPSGEAGLTRALQVVRQLRIMTRISNFRSGLLTYSGLIKVKAKLVAEISTNYQHEITIYSDTSLLETSAAALQKQKQPCIVVFPKDDDIFHVCRFHNEAVYGLPTFTRRQVLWMEAFALYWQYANDDEYRTKELLAFRRQLLSAGDLNTFIDDEEETLYGENMFADTVLAKFSRMRQSGRYAYVYQ